MRKVVNIINEYKNPLVPDIESLPEKYTRVKIKIVQQYSEQLASFNLDDSKSYLIEDNAGLVHMLILTDFSRYDAKVSDLYPSYKLTEEPFEQEEPISLSNFISPQATTNKWRGFIDELPPVQVIKPGDKPVTHKTEIKYTSCIKPKDYAMEVVNQKKLFDTHTPSLQKINLFLANTTDLFLDVDKLENMIEHLNDLDLNLLCSGKAFK